MKAIVRSCDDIPMVSMTTVYHYPYMLTTTLRTDPDPVPDLAPSPVPPHGRQFELPHTHSVGHSLGIAHGQSLIKFCTRSLL